MIHSYCLISAGAKIEKNYQLDAFIRTFVGKWVGRFPRVCSISPLQNLQFQLGSRVFKVTVYNDLFYAGSTFVVGLPSQLLSSPNALTSKQSIFAQTASLFSSVLSGYLGQVKREQPHSQ